MAIHLWNNISLPPWPNGPQLEVIKLDCPEIPTPRPYSTTTAVPLPSIKPLVNDHKHLLAKTYQFNNRFLNYPKAYRLYEELTQDDYVPGLISAAQCLIFAIGVKRDLMRAEALLGRVCLQELNDVDKGRIFWLLGLVHETMYIEKGRLAIDFRLSLNYYEKSSNYNNLFGSACLATLLHQQNQDFIRVKSIVKDIFSQLKEMALNSCFLSQFYLGNCFYLGIGVDQNECLAFQCFKAAADLGGLAIAQHSLGLLLRKNPEQLGEANAYLKKAEQQGFARTYLKIFYSE